MREGSETEEEGSTRRSAMKRARVKEGKTLYDLRRFMLYPDLTTVVQCGLGPTRLDLASCARRDVGRVRRGNQVTGMETEGKWWQKSEGRRGKKN